MPLPGRPLTPHLALRGPSQSALPQGPPLTPTSQCPVLGQPPRQSGRKTNRRPCLLHPPGLFHQQLLGLLGRPASVPSRTHLLPPPPWIRARFLLLLTRPPTPSMTSSPRTATQDPKGHPHFLPEACRPRSASLHVLLNPEAFPTATPSPLPVSQDRAAAAAPLPLVLVPALPAGGSFTPQLRVSRKEHLEPSLCLSHPSPHNHPSLGRADPQHSTGPQHTPSDGPSPEVRSLRAALLSPVHLSLSGALIQPPGCQGQHRALSAEHPHNQVRTYRN